MRQLYLPMRVWDLPTRLFHWVLVALLVFSWLSAWRDWMQLHIISGLTILTLLLFRLIWGFIGSETSRFVKFLKSPLAVFRHLSHLARREADREVGHNAAGGWMVLVLLALIAVQVGTGLCANDDIDTQGPLAQYVGKERSDWLTHIHHVNFTLIEVAAALHVLAVLLYRILKGQNLLTPMITGKKRLPGATRAPRMRSPLLALVVLALSATAVLGLLYFTGYSI